LLQDKESQWHWVTLDGVKLVMYQNRIYVPPALQQKTLDWYHHFLCHPGGQRLANTIASVCYWKGLTYQAGQVARKCPICQKCKVRNHRYGYLPPKEIDNLTPWDTVHIDLKGPYHITALQNKPGLKTECTDFHLLLMTMVDPATGWFEVAQVPIFDLSLISSGKMNIQLIQEGISLLWINLQQGLVSSLTRYGYHGILDLVKLSLIMGLSSRRISYRL